MLYVPHPTIRRIVLLDGADITRLCFWADDVTGDACLFVEKDGIQQTKESGTMLLTERKHGHITIMDTHGG